VLCVVEKKKKEKPQKNEMKIHFYKNKKKLGNEKQQTAVGGGEKFFK
jgi:hypothetical protein